MTRAGEASAPAGALEGGAAVTDAEHRAIVLPDGRHVVPGNRWDLVAQERPVSPPMVSVIVPYFEAQAELDLVLAALAQQTYPPGRLEVIVADDGSASPPTIPSQAGALQIQVVRQEDRGFRVSAARNLGAAAASGQVLLFLDGDTVPTPGYVEAMVRLPALLPDSLVVGARAHFELDGWEPPRLMAWLQAPAAIPGPRELPAPQWLVDIYDRTGDLLRIDDRGYEAVIGAVMAIDRALFDEIGGFDTTYEEYGGEDWEFAYRAFAAGAVLAHAPAARTVHAGDEWAIRSAADPAAVEQKRAEEARLADSIPGRAPRSARATGVAPELVVTLDEAMGQEAALATARSIVADEDADVVVWLPDAAMRPGPSSDLEPTAPALSDARAPTAAAAQAVPIGSATQATQAAEPRIRRGEPSPDAVARCRVRIHVAEPHRFAPGALVAMAAAVRAGEPAGALRIATGIEVVASRAMRRASRWSVATGRAPQDLVADLFGTRTQDGWPGADPLPADRHAAN